MGGWSEMSSQELKDKLHLFLAATEVTMGQVKGETKLPLPQQDSDKSMSRRDKTLIYEGSVNMWTKQIRHVLKLDPETELKKGNNPGPQVEIDFWKNKADNLNSVWEQLNSPPIQQVMTFLDDNHSTYSQPFQQLQKDVQQAMDEANEVSR